MIHRCKVCGSRYTPYYWGAFHRICRTCSLKGRTSARKGRPSPTQDLAEAHRAASVTPDATLSSAKTKPPRTSDVRWRIELRRRANAAYFADYGAPTDR